MTITDYSRHVLLLHAAMMLTACLAVSAVSAQGLKSPSLAKIHEQYSNFIFVVNAYSRTDGTTSDTSYEPVTWRRRVGTAFPLDHQGHLLTMHSVVKDAEKVKVSTTGGEEIDAEVIGCDATGKIAILKVDASHVTTLPKIQPWRSIEPDREVFFFGVIPGMEFKASQGFIRTIREWDGIIEVEAAGVAGTSGTPVFDHNHNLLGVLAFQLEPTAGAHSSSPYGNVYLVIPVEHATLLASNVIHRHEQSCGWLGLRIDLNSDIDNGVLIKDVMLNSPAARSGLKPEDIINEFAGRTIRTARQLSEAIDRTRAGEKVVVKVSRGGKQLAVDVTLAQQPGNE